MTDYIDRKAAIDAVLDVFYDTTDIDLSGEKLEAAILNVQAADVVPVRHGRWEKNVRGDYSIVCSECGYGLPTDAFAWMECNRTSEEREFCIWIADVKNYCPNCGCRMDEEVDT